MLTFIILDVIVMICYYLALRKLIILKVKEWEIYDSTGLMMAFTFWIIPFLNLIMLIKFLSVLPLNVNGKGSSFINKIFFIKE